MSKVTYDDMKEFLQASVSNVTFTKKNGETRILKCTLMPKHLPPVEVKEGEEKAERKVNTDVVSVWDLENKGWRSFRLDSVVEFEAIDY